MARVVVGAGRCQAGAGLRLAAAKAAVAGAEAAGAAAVALQQAQTAYDQVAWRQDSATLPEGTYAIANSETMIAKVQGFTSEQIADQCKQFAPAMQPHVAALALKTQAEVVQDVAGFILKFYFFYFFRKRLHVFG